MRIVRTGGQQVFTLEFVKNYLKIDPDITIEDDVVAEAIEAAADEADQLLMYTGLMDTFEVIIPWTAVEGTIRTEDLVPVQRLTDLKVKEYNQDNQLTDDTTLTEDDDYTYTITTGGMLEITLTEQGKGKIDRGQYLVANVLAGTYATAEEVPAATRKAMLKMIADMIEYRVDTNNVKAGDWRASDRQIWLRRKWRF